MALSGTSWAALAVVVGGMAGTAVVANDDWFTQLVGFSTGCIAALCICLAFRYIVRAIPRHSRAARTPKLSAWDDYDEQAYKVERTFMDDGKPW
jgi:hypothetical protein